jgi:hypothetical protein
MIMVGKLATVKKENMRYDLSNQNHRKLLVEHSSLEGDACPVDDICDSIPAMLDFIRMVEEQLRSAKSERQRVQAELSDAHRKINNLKSQKFRVAKKKGKTLYQ